MKRTDLSIIIPAYNANKFIGDCLDSIFKQSGIENWEVIVVDDCSVDNTKKIIQEYSVYHNNLRLLINPKNSGPSVARNNGIEHSNGQFVTFIDADDCVGLDWGNIKPLFSDSHNWSSVKPMQFYYAHMQKIPNLKFSDNYFIKLLESAQDTKTDVSMAGKVTVDPINNVLKAHIYDKEYVLGDTSDDKFIAMENADVRENANFALYKRSFLDKHKLRFDSGMRLDEDILFCMQATLHARQTVLVPDCTYMYNKLVQSASKPTDNNNAYKRAHIQRMSVLLADLCKKPEYKNIFIRWLSEFRRQGLRLQESIANSNEKLLLTPYELDSKITKESAQFPVDMCRKCKNAESDKCFYCENLRFLIQSNLNEYCK